ncbi:MAG: DUF2058 domain-containing protein [Arenimonas sp.]
MAKLNSLQEQLHKAGLAKKSKVAAAAREQGKAPAGPSEVQRDAERAREEKVERDRALAAERKAQAHAHELRAQARQIVNDRKLPRTGEREYRFTANGAIRTLLVDEDQRRKLASGALVIAAMDDRYELLPRAAGEQVRQRDAGMIVLDHGQSADAAASSIADDDAHYARFEVPDDLMW